MLMQPAQREPVTGRSQSGDLRQGHAGDMRMVAKRLPLMDVRQMHFNGGQSYGRNGIANRDARMGVGGRIDDDPLIATAALLNPIDQFPFAVGLMNIHFHRQFLGQAGQGSVYAVE